MSTPEKKDAQELFEPGYYIPGHAGRKLLIILCGILLVLFGISQMRTPLRLLFTGGKARAEAASVIKTKPGLPDVILTNDLDIRARQETRDRSYTFWNEFRFQDSGGREFVVRAEVGSKLKPLYPIVDEDGLPTSLPVHYDPRHPETVSFPTIFSTWFAPGALVIIGLGFILIGSFLFYWAGKPIELPHIPAPLDASTAHGPPGAT